MRAENLQCAGQCEPLAVGSFDPVLTWRLSAPGLGRMPTAFRVRVATGLKSLDDQTSLIWDTGAICWTGLPQLQYAGRALIPEREYSWQVRLQDEAGAWGPWSAVATWRMAPGTWYGDWIGQRLPPAPCWRPPHPALRSDAHHNDFGGLPALYLRCAFRLDRPVHRARLHATARGLYRASINGVACGRPALTPGWMNYHRRIAYQTHDVTDLLRPGDNALGAVLGEGWFSGRISEHAKYPAGHYGAQPWYLCQLALDYEDGTHERIVSDQAWRVSHGPIAYSDLLNGEVYDARQELEGWDSPDYDDRSWLAVTTKPRDGIVLEPEISPSVCVTEDIVPTVVVHSAGRLLVDFGQNLAGRVELALSGKAGAAVHIRHGEMVDAEGRIYAANLGRAAQVDTYVCAGDGVRRWEPSYTIHGFRYAELTGIEDIDIQSVSARVLHADLPVSGRFSCGHPLVQRLQQNIRWGLRSNLQSVPTDCPSRDERLGWLGDAQLFAGTAAAFFDVRQYFSKWLQDIWDAQAADGTIPDMAPFISPAFDFFADGAPGWADAAVVIPWTLWRRYGDTALIARCWQPMMAWMDNLERRFPDGLRRGAGNDYGDWLNLDAPTDVALIATSLYAQIASMMADMASALGRTAERRRFAACLKRIKASFGTHFLQDDARLTSPTQTAYALALSSGVVPTHKRARMTRHLVSEIEARGRALSTGFIGTRYVMAALSENGHADVAYDLLLRKEYPSWGYMIEQGATTIWERWNSYGDGFAEPEMNSFNHAALGSVGQWLFENVAGLRGVTPGWSEIAIRPHFDPRLDWCEAEQWTPCGPASVRWGFSGGELSVRVNIPAGVRAKVLLPATRDAIWQQGDAPVARTCSVTVGRRPGTVASIGSGYYNFMVRL